MEDKRERTATTDNGRTVVRITWSSARVESLNTCWVDCSKAYDMTPHPWIKEMLKAIRAPKVVRRGLRKVMSLWKKSVWREASRAVR